MKRKRELDVPVLGATEFAMTISGDDPRAILDGLRRFAGIVRRQRRLALCVKEEMADLESDDESEAAEEAIPTKRLKKDEAWKEDIAEYNVPFVGTSVPKGDTGRVVIGEWPTGLLQAYLRKSPLAVELTGDALIPGLGHIHKSLIRNKKGRTSKAIYKAYLKAIVELLSAAVPIEKLRVEDDGADDSVDEAYVRFVPAFVKHRLPGLLNLLKEETGNGKGKASVKGGCGELAPIVLDILSVLSATSTPTARHVARSLEGLPPGVLRILTRPQANQKTDGAEEAVSGLSVRDKARAASMRLASTLTEHGDFVVFSRISTAGARDRKVQPGILYLCMKDGLLDLATGADAGNGPLLGSVYEMILSVLSLAMKDAVPKRLLATIFTSECVQNLGELSSYAPVFTVDATVSNDSPGVTLLERVGSRSRRLLLLLLSEKNKSPLLSGLQIKDKNATYAEQTIVRALTGLASSQKGVEMHRFLVDCMFTSPLLVPALFRAFAAPDPKNCFGFVKSMSFVQRVLQYGPPLADCMAAMVKEEHGKLATCCLWPSSFQKQWLSRALQSPNALVVTETLKFLVRALRRIRPYMDERDDSSDLLSYVAKRLPDVQVVLSTMSRFGITKTAPGCIVINYVCELLKTLFAGMPDLVQDVTFDWSKLMPRTVREFCSAPLVVQVKILNCLNSVLTAQERSVISGKHPVLIRFFLELMLTTLSTRVHLAARALAILLLQSRRTDDPVVDDVESACWIDGMTEDTLPELASLFTDLSQDAMSSRMVTISAWKASGYQGPAPRQAASPVLIRALQNLHQHSEAFVLLACQVAVKLLSASLNPIPLAVSVAAMAFGNEPGMEMNFSVRALQRYANSLIAFDPAEGDICLNVLISTFSTLFGPAAMSAMLLDEAGLATIKGWELAPSFLASDYVSLLHLMLHLRLIGSTVDQMELPIFQFLMPIVLRLPGLEYTDLRPFALDHYLKLNDRPLVENIIIHSGVRVTVNSSERLWADFVGTVSVLEGRLLYCYFLVNILPCHLIGLWAQSFAALIEDASRPLSDRRVGAKIATVALRRIRETGAYSHVNENLIDTIFECLKSSPSWLDANCLSGVMDFLAWLLATDTPVEFSHHVYMRFRNYGDHEMIDLILRSINRAGRDGGGCGDGDATLLVLLLDCDALRYAPALVQCLGETMGSRLLENGVLDQALRQMLSCHTIPLKSSDLMSLSADLERRACLELGKVLPSALQITSLTETLRAILDFPAAFAERGHDELSRTITLSLGNMAFGSEVQDAVLGLAHLFISKSLDCALLRRDMARALLFFIVHRRLPTSIRSDSTARDIIPKVVLWAEACLLEALSDNERLWAEMDTFVSLCLGYVFRTKYCSLEPREVSLLRLVGRIVDGFAELPSRNRHAMQRLVMEVITADQVAIDLLRNDDAAGAEAKLLLLEILCSLESFHDFVQYLNKVIPTLLTGFLAGVKRSDQLIRLLLSKLSSNDGLPLNAFQWGEAKRVGTLGIDVWGWLVGSIETRRMYATVADFPLNDPIVPLPMNMLPTKKSNFQGRDDQRYSPGFLLPLILGALEGDSMSDSVHMAHGLVEKGCLALSLVSLSSHCNAVRKYAIAILGRFIRIVQSTEAQQVAAWRQRPQMDLLLTSVQRALVIMRAADKEGVSQIPRISGFAAVFLGRSSFVLTRPGDDMFPSINRLLLQTEAEHGAFQDLRKLPAFVSLFCSSSDEPLVASKQRCWALKIVRDGFSGDDGYRALVSCHALELILSSIETSRMTCGDWEEEASVLLSTLARIVSVGGDKCASHLFGRLGLLYWYRSILTGRSTNELFPSLACCLAFLEVVISSVSLAKRTLTTNELVVACRGLGEPLLRLFLLVASEADSQDLGFTSLSVSACRLLSLLGQEAGEDGTMQSCDGLSIRSSWQFLSSIKVDSAAKCDAVIGLCRYPLCPEDLDTESTIAFCKTALHSLVESDANVEGMKVILNRVAFLALTSMDPDPSLQAALLKVRHRCSIAMETEAAWQGCLDAVQNDKGETGTYDG